MNFISTKEQDLSFALRFTEKRMMLMGLVLTVPLAAFFSGLHSLIGFKVLLGIIKAIRAVVFIDIVILTL